MVRRMSISSHLTLSPRRTLLFKSVPHAAQRYDAVAVRAKTLTQQLYVGIQRAVVSVKVVAPYLANKLFAGEGNVGVSDHIKQQVVFLWRKLHQS